MGEINFKKCPDEINNGTQTLKMQLKPKSLKAYTLIK